MLEIGPRRKTRAIKQREAKSVKIEVYFGPELERGVLWLDGEYQSGPACRLMVRYRPSLLRVYLDFVTGKSVTTLGGNVSVCHKTASLEAIGCADHMTIQSLPSSSAFLASCLHKRHRLHQHPSTVNNAAAKSTSAQSRPRCTRKVLRSAFGDGIVMHTSVSTRIRILDQES